MTLVATAANVAWCASCAPAYATFRAALADPRKAQLRILNRYVQRNVESEFGTTHAFKGIDDLESFRRAVPLRDYDELAPWIDRIVSGGQRVLGCDPVTRLVPSSGSVRAAKLIPYTVELQREFNRAIGPWIVDLYCTTPDLMRGCAYWSVTPVAQQPDITENSAIPIGFEDDSAYLGDVRRRLVDALMAVGSEVRHLQKIEEFRFETARQLLRRRDLRLISVWHPSFLNLLLDKVQNQWGELLQAVGRGDPAREAELQRIENGDWRAIWPNLGLISCWTDASAAGPAEALRKRLPNVMHQSKGLLATEAFVSIPFAGHWPLAIRSHFFEFEDDQGRVLLADELRDECEYGVIVTTAGGLWRYRLGDRVRCDGFVGYTPSIRFIGRSDLVVDQCGEKLSEGFVGQTLRRVLAQARVEADFAMLAPDACGGESCYTFFLSTNTRISGSSDFTESLDQALRLNPHYAYCRDLGQLGHPRLFQIDGDAYLPYIAVACETGRRMGDVKPVALDGRCDWSRRFVGHYLAENAVSAG